MKVDLSQTQWDKTKLLIMEVDLNKTQRDKAKNKTKRSSSWKSTYVICHESLTDTRQNILSPRETDLYKSTNLVINWIVTSCQEQASPNDE